MRLSLKLGEYVFVSFTLINVSHLSTFALFFYHVLFFFFLFNNLFIIRKEATVVGNEERDVVKWFQL